MSPTHTSTRRVTRPAAHDWRTSAACQGIDVDTLFSEKPTEQKRTQRICQGCPVRTTCLRDALDYEFRTYMVWGTAGGLLDWQRKALNVHAQLGEHPHLGQARVLASPVFAGFMREWRDWPADVVAGELRKIGVLAAPVTVRVALWWSGAHGGVLRPVEAGDVRVPWMRVRDECRPLVERLRGRGFSNRDIVAYLGVRKDNLERAVTAWRAADETARGVAA